RQRDRGRDQDRDAADEEDLPTDPHPGSSRNAEPPRRSDPGARAAPGVSGEAREDPPSRAASVNRSRA
ncbi:hypothetical protein, partial [Methylobacterium soli]|uniref:hypothetical protein n=1 Tax=Methylobacterium soli TaxID=553447 RepID=UPI001EE2D888